MVMVVYSVKFYRFMTILIKLKLNKVLSFSRLHTSAVLVIQHWALGFDKRSNKLWPKSLFNVFNTLTAIFPIGLKPKASLQCHRPHGVNKFIFMLKLCSFLEF